MKVRFRHPMLDEATLTKMANRSTGYGLSLLRYNMGRRWEHATAIYADDLADAKEQARREIRSFIAILKKAGLRAVARRSRR